MLNAGCGLLAPLKDQVEAKAVQETSILYKLTMKSSHRSLQTAGQDTSPTQTFFGSSRNPLSFVTRVRTKTAFKYLIGGFHCHAIKNTGKPLKQKV